jgi:hypothetical protein
MSSVGDNVGAQTERERIMSHIEIASEGPIYRNPNPGYEHVSTFFSHLVQLTDGEILCTYNRGSAIYATDLTFHAAHSTDGGQSWPEQTVIHDRSTNDAPYSYHDPMLALLSDGTLVITAFRIDRSDPDRPLFNDRTGGMCEFELVLLRSSDRGRSWSRAEQMTVPNDLLVTPSSGVLELEDGRWFLSFDRWHAFDSQQPYRPQVVGLFSADRGRTWSDPIVIAATNSQNKGFWHGQVLRLNDGRLFTMFWTALMKSDIDNQPLHRCIGSADAMEWSEPEPTDLPGQTNHAVDLGEGRMLDVYTRRDGAQPGFFAVLSADEGKTWDLENQVCVWDASGRDKLGVEAPDTYPRSHDTIAFGAPRAIRLADGDVLATYWCTEMSVTHIRSARLSVSET